MRANRIISILILLQTQGRLTSRELAQQLEVSERTIHRDMDALSLAGIPVYAERGQGGGWQLLEDYRTSLTGLNLAEIQTLFLQTPHQVLADLGLENTADIALLKLLSSLSSSRQNSANFLSERIHIDMGSWRDISEETPYLRQLQSILWQDKQAHIIYERSDGTRRERIISPLGLVAKGSVWYLIAHVEDDIRTYRVSRIQSVQYLPQDALRPANFNLADYWIQSMQDFKANLPRFSAQIQAHTDALPRLKFQGRFVQVQEIHINKHEDWHHVDLVADTEEEACRFVMGFGGFVKVVNPPSLQQMVVTRAEAILTRYQS